MKRRIFAAAVILIIVSVIVSGTIAFYTKDVTVTNVVTAGNVTVHLELTQKTSAGEGPAQDELAVIPGTSYSRIARVKNIGYAPAWVRVKADVTFTMAPAADSAGNPSLVSITGVNTMDWTAQDGYWYYNKALQPGETTAALFTGVAFDAAMDDLYQGGKVKVETVLEAVQTDHNGANALEADGWPQS